MSSNNVDTVTHALAQTGIADNETQKVNGNANENAVPTSAAEGRRLYVGNLAYATTEEELKDFFKDVSM